MIRSPGGREFSLILVGEFHSMPSVVEVFQPPQAIMDTFDPDQLHLHDAALQTMRVADPDRAEEMIREAFNAGGTGWTGWDEQFIEFIDAHRRKGLIYGTVGDGWHFLFCPADSKGIWVCLREGMTGKGLLRDESVAALTEIAVEKGLVERPTPA